MYTIVQSYQLEVLVNIRIIFVDDVFPTVKSNPLRVLNSFFLHISCAKSLFKTEFKPSGREIIFGEKKNINTYYSGKRFFNSRN